MPQAATLVANPGAYGSVGGDHTAPSNTTYAGPQLTLTQNRPSSTLPELDSDTSKRPSFAAMMLAGRRSISTAGGSSMTPTRQTTRAPLTPEPTAAPAGASHLPTSLIVGAASSLPDMKRGALPGGKMALRGTLPSVFGADIPTTAFSPPSTMSAHTTDPHVTHKPEMGMHLPRNMRPHKEDPFKNSLEPSRSTPSPSGFSSSVAASLFRGSGVEPGLSGGMKHSSWLTADPAPPRAGVGSPLPTKLTQAGLHRSESPSVGQHPGLGAHGTGASLLPALPGIRAAPVRAATAAG